MGPINSILVSLADLSLYGDGGTTSTSTSTNTEGEQEQGEEEEEEEGGGEEEEGEEGGEGEEEEGEEESISTGYSSSSGREQGSSSSDLFETVHSPSLCPSVFPTNIIKLTLDTNLVDGRNEIDAVLVHGVRNLEHREQPGKKIKIEI